MSKTTRTFSSPLLAGLVGTALTGGLLAQDDAAAAVQKRIADHFEQVVAELTRYRKFVIYGETLSQTRPTDAQLREEQELFTAAMATSAARTLPTELHQLGHNLVVFEPTLPAPAGTERPMTKAYLRALLAVAPEGSEAIQSALFLGSIAAGELGEQEMVANLGTESEATRNLVAYYLSQMAIYSSSAAPIEKRIAVETNTEIRAMLIQSLATIGMPSSAKLVRELAANEKEDVVQAAAIFACVELEGFPAIEYLAGLSPKGELAKHALDDGLGYLRRETNAKNLHGREVGSDEEFVQRFGDLRSCPTIAWLRDIGRLDEDAVTKAEPLSAEHKKKLLELLVDSKGFGLEAIKGALFASLAKEDEAMLLKIRAANMSSPNRLMEGRRHTLGIMLRRVRQGP